MADPQTIMAVAGGMVIMWVAMSFFSGGKSEATAAPPPSAPLTPPRPAGAPAPPLQRLRQSLLRRPRPSPSRPSRRRPPRPRPRLPRPLPQRRRRRPRLPCSPSPCVCLFPGVALRGIVACAWAPVRRAEPPTPPSPPTHPRATARARNLIAPQKKEKKEAKAAAAPAPAPATAPVPVPAPLPLEEGWSRPNRRGVARG